MASRTPKSPSKKTTAKKSTRRTKANSDERVESALAAGRKRSYADVAEELEGALHEGLGRFSLSFVLAQLGHAYDMLDRREEAGRTLRAAVELGPHDPEAWSFLGIHHRLCGDYDDAEHCYTRALALCPTDYHTLTSLGVLYILRDKSKKAVDALERAVELGSRVPGTFGNLALAYAMQFRFDDAEATLDKAVALGYPNDEYVRERLLTLRASHERTAMWLFLFSQGRVPTIPELAKELAEIPRSRVTKVDNGTFLVAHDDELSGRTVEVSVGLNVESHVAQESEQLAELYAAARPDREEIAKSDARYELIYPFVQSDEAKSVLALITDRLAKLTGGVPFDSAVARFV